MKVPFSPPFINDEIRREVINCLDSGWITTGPRVENLEAIVAGHVGTGNVLCCNSATSGLMLALHWFGVTRGDEVIMPAYTYAATALSVMHLGATPVLADSGDDFNINVDRIREKITERTKVIMPVDIAGWPCHYNAINSLVSDPAIKVKFRPVNNVQKDLGRILVLSDAAHSFGAVYHGKASGALADLSVFSFHAVKNLTTAEGGAICITLPPPFINGDVYKTLKLWSLNGQTKSALQKSQTGAWKYDIVYPGFKMNMPDVLAAIGIAQLKTYHSDLLPERKRIFERYESLFSGNDWAQLPVWKSDSIESSCHIYPLRIRDISESQRDEMINFISSREVSVNVHFQPLPLLQIFRERGYRMDDYPEAYNSYSREISLPIYNGLSDEQIRFVAESVSKAYSHVMENEKVF